jgi:hypothetical protein
VTEDAVRPTHCIFQEDWWLDAVAPDAWAVATVGSGRDIQARLPYVHTRRRLYSSIRQPHVTQTLGPWFRPTAEKPAAAVGREHQLAKELLAQLPRSDFISMNLHHSITNWLPYLWMGFDVVPKVSYLIEQLGSSEEMWEGLQPNIRREIRKAEKRVEVVRGDDVDQFIAVNRKSFERQNLAIPYSPETLRRVDAACVTRNARRIYFARDEQGRHHAAVYIVHDDRRAHYLLGGGDTELRTSGAMSLLLWRALVDSIATSRGFNFQGSVLQGLERFLRAFGGEQKTFMNVRRANWKATLALAVRGTLQRG